MIIQYDKIGCDLYAVFDCTCNNKLQISGYNDDYFFKRVNKQPNIINCNYCNTTIWYQWTKDSLEVRFK